MDGEETKEMTIRPFKIQFYIYNKKIKLCRILDHRGKVLAKDIKIPNYKKLLSYPITAFGYEMKLENPTLINPKFDRTDVIKALDFWIEYWVYQNKKDYILEGTVNKDFELTVRELIETREAVLKMPANTEFVRQKIRMSEIGTQVSYKDSDDITKIPKFVEERIVEFTENVLNSSNNSASTVDQFCYVVRKMTYKEYMCKKNGILDLTNSSITDQDISRLMTSLQEETTFVIGTPGSWTTMAERVSLIDPQDFDTDHWRVASDDEHPGTMKIVDIRGHDITTGFRDVSQARVFINGVRDRFRSVPADGTNPNNWVVVKDGPNTFRIVNTDGVNIAGGFNTRLSAELYLVHVRENFLPSEVSVRESQQEGPDHLLHSNLHPGIPSSTDQPSLVFENMHLSSIDGFSFTADIDTFMSVPVNFIGLDGIEITMNMFLTPTQQVHMFDGPLGTVHQIRITPGSQNPVEIDGTEYHVVDINISYNPRNSLPFIFRDLLVQSVNLQSSRMGIEFRGHMGLTEIGVGLEINLPEILLNETINHIRDSTRSWDLEITGGNSVRIGNNGFEVTEPIHITIR